MVNKFQYKKYLSLGEYLLCGIELYNSLNIFYRRRDNKKLSVGEVYSYRILVIFVARLVDGQIWSSDCQKADKIRLLIAT